MRPLRESVRAVWVGGDIWLIRILNSYETWVCLLGYLANLWISGSLGTLDDDVPTWSLFLYCYYRLFSHSMIVKE